MPLTELMIKQAKPGEKNYTLYDGDGLLLQVRPNGKKYWIVRYWVGGKEKRTSFGTFPEVTLKMAREKNFDFRRSGPTTSDKFAAVAEEFMERRARPKMAQSYVRVMEYRLSKYILPALGKRPVSSISAKDVLDVCRGIENDGTVETAHRVKQLIGQVFKYAIATGRMENDPTLALRGALTERPRQHYATITDPEKIAELMTRIRAYPHSDIVRLALMFSALVFCRPGEVRQAEWTEIEEDVWRIPAEKTKMKRVHLVPLAKQTLQMLEELRLLTGYQRWLFPSIRLDGHCMSENTIRVALRNMGYTNEDMTAHGFRAMASTILNEHEFPSDVIERQLAHAEKNSIRAAYNHAEYMPQRKKLMQWWADWLDGLKS